MENNKSNEGSGSISVTSMDETSSCTKKLDKDESISLMNEIEKDLLKYVSALQSRYKNIAILNRIVIIVTS